MPGVQPVPGDAGRCHVQLRQARGDLAVHLQTAMGRHLLDQRLPDQLMPEAVADARRHQHPGGERRIERRQGGYLQLGTERFDRAHVEFIAAQRQPFEHHERRLGNVAQACRDGFGRVAG